MLRFSLYYPDRKNFWILSFAEWTVLLMNFSALCFTFVLTVFGFIGWAPKLCGTGLILYFPNKLNAIYKLFWLNWLFCVLLCSSSLSTKCVVFYVFSVRLANSLYFFRLLVWHACHVVLFFISSLPPAALIPHVYIVGFCTTDLPRFEFQGVEISKLWFLDFGRYIWYTSTKNTSVLKYATSLKQKVYASSTPEGGGETVFPFCYSGLALCLLIRFI